MTISGTLRFVCKWSSLLKILLLEFLPKKKTRFYKHFNIILTSGWHTHSHSIKNNFSFYSKPTTRRRRNIKFYLNKFNLRLNIKKNVIFTCKRSSVVESETSFKCYFIKSTIPYQKWWLERAKASPQKYLNRFWG